MGCLNSTGKFPHWFGNIHLSGPCNRKCYFCIGQHMMALDQQNTLTQFPLPGMHVFVDECRKHPIKAVYLTGTNTDPSLYYHPNQLVNFLRQSLNVPVGIRTNGVNPRPVVLRAVSMGSLTICSLNLDINHAMMGGAPPNVSRFLEETTHWTDLKVNIVLGPENVPNGDWLKTVVRLRDFGIKRVNLREPYGQPHIGNPIERLSFVQTLGMPTYDIYGVEVTYWDVHYVEVESVNLYASGRVSVDYPISRGHADSGEVHPQSHWIASGRHTAQWVGNGPFGLSEGA